LCVHLDTTTPNFFLPFTRPSHNRLFQTLTLLELLTAFAVRRAYGTRFCYTNERLADYISD
jgi:hypothetical protein